MALCMASDKANEVMCFCKWNSRWISGNKSVNWQNPGFFATCQAHEKACIIDIVRKDGTNHHLIWDEKRQRC